MNEYDDEAKSREQCHEFKRNSGWSHVCWGYPLNDEKGNARLKTVARHPDYGNVLMLYWNKTDGVFLTVEYDAITDKNELRMAFRDLKLMQSF